MPCAIRAERLALVLSRELRQALQQAAESPDSRSLTGLAERLRLPVVASLPGDGLDNLVTRRRACRAPAFVTKLDYQGESS